MLHPGFGTITLRFEYTGEENCRISLVEPQTATRSEKIEYFPCRPLNKYTNPPCLYLIGRLIFLTRRNALGGKYGIPHEWKRMAAPITCCQAREFFLRAPDWPYVETLDHT